MSWIDKIKPNIAETTSAGQLRSFGLIVGGVFLLIGLWPMMFHATGVRTWSLVLGGVLAIAALIVPAALGKPYRAWMIIGHYLGWMNTRIVMATLFYAVLTPVALIMRLIKRDAMHRNFEKSLSTYRVVKTVRPASHMKHQF